MIITSGKHNDYYTEKPIMIIEILSAATAKYDRSFKLYTYKQITSLVEYVMIEQHKHLVEVYRRVNGVWGYVAYGLDDDVHFGSIDLTFSVKDIYECVEIRD